MVFDHILFDLVGTLTDSYEGIAKSVKFACFLFVEKILSAMCLKNSTHCSIMELESI